MNCLTSSTKCAGGVALLEHGHLGRQRQGLGHGGVVVDLVDQLLVEHGVEHDVAALDGRASGCVVGVVVRSGAWISPASSAASATVSCSTGCAEVLLGWRPTRRRRRCRSRSCSGTARGSAPSCSGARAARRGRPRPPCGRGSARGRAAACFTSCWVIVEPPWVTSPARAFTLTARRIARKSTPWWSQKRSSSMAMTACCTCDRDLVEGEVGAVLLGVEGDDLGPVGGVDHRRLGVRGQLGRAARAARRSRRARPSERRRPRRARHGGSPGAHGSISRVDRVRPAAGRGGQDAARWTCSPTSRPAA